MSAQLVIPVQFQLSDEDMIPASELNPAIYELATHEEQQRDSDYAAPASIRILYQLADVKYG